MEHLKLPVLCLLVFCINELEGELANKVATVVVIQSYAPKRVVKDFFKPSRHMLLSWINKMMAKGVFPPSFPEFYLKQGNSHGMHYSTVHYYKVLILIILYFSTFGAISTI